MSSVQPFYPLFESLDRLPPFHAEGINQRASEALLDVLTVPPDHPGRCILLRAPRAGFGKTHLLSRLQHRLAASHEFIPLQPAAGSRVDAASVTDDVLRRVGRPLPAGGGLCGLDLRVRRWFALALQPLVASGDVPCMDRDQALASLLQRPVETFDFHHPDAITACWIRDHFEVLGPRLALELAPLVGVAPRALGFWVDALFRFAVTPPEVPGRIDVLSQAAAQTHSGDGAAMERLAALLALLGLQSRVVLVADDLEGFSADEMAALRLAAFLSSLRQSVERPEVILSLNRDVWDSAFVPRLSSGLVDRLSEVVVELTDLTEAQMAAILDSRTPGHGPRVLDSMRPTGLPCYARGLLRAAGVAWHPAPPQPATAAVGNDHPAGGEPPPPWPPPVFTPSPPPFPPTPTPVAAGDAAVSKSPPAVAPASPFAVPAGSPAAAGLASPFTVPSLNREPPQPSEADWHALTGPTSPFDSDPGPGHEPGADSPAAGPPPIDHQRVAELLRQFRERYSQPNP